MLLCFGHGCSGDRMLLEDERYSALGMDALVAECNPKKLWFLPDRKVTRWLL